MIINEERNVIDADISLSVIRRLYAACRMVYVRVVSPGTRDVPLQLINGERRISGAFKN